jgi:hypothetical protein
MFVQWALSPKKDGKVHIVQRKGFTLCGRRFGKAAVSTKKPPRDKAMICKFCGEIDDELQQYKNLFK